MNVWVLEPAPHWRRVKGAFSHGFGGHIDAAVGGDQHHHGGWIDFQDAIKPEKPFLTATGITGKVPVRKNDVVILVFYQRRYFLRIYFRMNQRDLPFEKHTCRQQHIVIIAYKQDRAEFTVHGYQLR